MKAEFCLNTLSLKVGLVILPCNFQTLPCKLDKRIWCYIKRKISLAILLTCLVDDVLASLGGVACLSLLGVKLRKDIFSTFFGHV